MTRLAFRFARLAAPLALIAAAAAILASCSGAVSGPPQVNDPTVITVLPASTPANGVIAYSGLPTTLTITGGTGSYIVSSNNQAVIQVAGAVTGNAITFIPNPVLADTNVTITVRDTGTTPSVNATVTVKPGTVANDITITPSSTQAAACGTNIVCSGGDALVTATISQGGIPLPARGVMFSVVSGDFRFITSDPNASVETLDTQTIVNTDQTGKASARIRVFASAPNQTALVQVTDQGTGAYLRAPFIIAQSTGTSPGFFLTPSSVTFQGTRTDQCANTSTSANFFIFGGVPPYTVASTSSALFLNRTNVSCSGCSFAVTPSGTCIPDPGTPIIVQDSAGHTASATVKNVPGTQSPPALVVGPTTVSLTSCNTVAAVTAAGGTGNYMAVSGNSAVQVFQSGNTFGIQRAQPTPATPGPVTVSISDGSNTVDVTVDLVGQGAGACPAVAVNPATVTLTSCSAVTAIMGGGSGNFAAVSSNPAVTATVAGTTLTIRRTVGSASFAPPSTVTVSDSANPSNNASVTVNATGAGLGGC